MSKSKTIGDIKNKYVNHREALINNDKRSKQLALDYGTQPDWKENKVVAFDLETTSRRPDTARIVTASIVESWGSEATPDNSVFYEWLVRPSEPISDEAYRVHGVSDADADKDGLDGEYAVKQIVSHLQKTIDNKIPIVGYNSAYDFTVLNRECLRLGIAPLDEAKAILIDPLIVDLFFDPDKREPNPETKYKGTRQLSDNTVFYGCSFDNAHNSSYDCLATINITKVIIRRFEEQTGCLSAKQISSKLRSEWKPEVNRVRKMKGTYDDLFDTLGSAELPEEWEPDLISK